MNLEDFLIDTLNYYGNDCTRRVLGCHRTKHSSGFVYRKCSTSDGDPVGRHLSEQLRETMDKRHSGALITSLPPSQRSQLPEWMQEIPIELLNNIQSMHDTDMYWNKDKGLTLEGIKWVKNFVIVNKLNPERFKKYTDVQNK